MKQPQDMTTKELIREIDYQTTPGAHTFITGVCGHLARGGGATCADCLDLFLLARNINIEYRGSSFAYERVDGRLRRKVKGAARRVREGA